MSTCVKVLGAILKVEIATVMTAVPNCTDVGDTQEKAPGIDCSALSDSFVQQTAGMPDLGSITATMNYDPANSVHQFLADNIGQELDAELLYPNSGPNKQAVTGPLLQFAGKGGDRGALFKRDFELKCNTLTNS